MIIWGISALSHDAAISVVSGNDILFGAHAERYSKKKNDKFLNTEIINEALSFGKPDKIVWFEKPIKKKFRQAIAGEWSEVFAQSPKQYLASCGLGEVAIEYVDHHESHAAGGFYTSGLTDASILVCDAIGEFATTSIWKANGPVLEKVFERKYPHSIGLFYSAITHRVGLKPNEEEFILMGMAAYGQPRFVDVMKKELINIDSAPNFTALRNLHLGCLDWLVGKIETDQDRYDIAASAQAIVEEYMVNTAAWIKRKLPSRNLVIAGGVALNCVSNEKIAKLKMHQPLSNEKLFSNIWIMPNPGDSGSSLGAIAASERKYLTWDGPYLGTNIDRNFDIEGIVSALAENGVVAIANGRAEFGPRSLGNRSLIADPRGQDIKDRVNDIKQRQRFRPFAPMILEEFAHEFFDLPVDTTPYMQFTAKCKFPELFPAICHFDGTSRVQTVNRKQNERIHQLLTKFYLRTGCPMLLNTSLNIKGQPLVNDWDDAVEFGKKYKVQVF